MKKLFDFLRDYRWRARHWPMTREQYAEAVEESYQKYSSCSNTEIHEAVDQLTFLAMTSMFFSPMRVAIVDGIEKVLKDRRIIQEEDQDLQSR